MATQKQQQDEMVNSFVASIPAMQIDIALLKQDTTILKNSSLTIIERLDKLSVVSKADFDKHIIDDQKWRDDFLKDIDARFNKIEAFINDSKPGIKFANALVSRWITFLVLLILVAATIALVGRFVPLNIGV